MRRLTVASIALALSVSLLLGLGAGTGEAHQGPHGTVSIDHTSGDNTAAAIGATQACAEKSLSAGEEFSVDLVVQGIPGNDEDMGAFQVRLTFDSSILEFVSVIASDPASEPKFFLEKSGLDTAPASHETAAGDWLIGVFQLGPDRGNTGDGLLARLNFRALGDGVSNINLEPGDGVSYYTDVRFINHPFEVLNSGAVGINQACAVTQPTATPEGGPQPTGTPGAQPTGTPDAQPTATPDADGDAVPDVDDKCSGTPAGASADPSGCSDVQLEQLKQEARDQLIDTATAGLNLAVSLDTVVVGGSTDVLAAIADENGGTVPGVDVTFKIDEQPGSDATLDGQPSLERTSDADGVAEARLHVGTTPGQVVVSATARGETKTVSVSVVRATVGQGTPVATPTSDRGADTGDDSGVPLWSILAAGLGGGALALAGLAWLARSRRNRST
jgi:hypothetical protein